MVWRGVAEQWLRSAAALSALGQALRSVPHRVVVSWLQCFSSNLWALDSLTEALILFCCLRCKEAGVLMVRCSCSPTTYLGVGFTRQGKQKMDAQRAMPSPIVFVVEEHWSHFVPLTI